MRRLFLVLLLVAGCTGLLPASEEAVVVRSYVFPPAIDPVDNHPEFMLWERIFAQEPYWNGPAFSDPPLSMVEAIELARGELAKHTYQGKMQVSQVRLTHLAIGPTRGWVYVVTWHRCDECKGIAIPVLLSGRAVEGRTKGK